MLFFVLAYISGTRAFWTSRRRARLSEILSTQKHQNQLKHWKT